MKTWKLPPNYSGTQWAGWLVAPVSRNRDSDALTQANWQAQWETLHPLVADVPREDCASPCIVRENHWAVGWVEWVAIHPSNTAAVAMGEQLEDRLESYPVLDEEYLAELEADEYAMEWPSLCRDWVRMLAEEFGLRPSTKDRLDDISTDAWRTLYEECTPSGDFYQDNGMISRLRSAASHLSRSKLAQFIQSHRTGRPVTLIKTT